LLLKMMNELPGVQGVKQSAGDLKLMADLMLGVPAGCKIYTAVDALLYSSFALGCHGTIAANPAAVPGVQPQTHFRELLTQVPLVMQQFEAAVREELGIDTEPPPPNGRVRFLTRKPPLDDLAGIGQDLSRER